MKRIVFRALYVFLLLFAQQSALAHVAWHAQQGAPAKHDSSSKASFQGGLCDLDVVFSKVLGSGGTASHHDVPRPGRTERVLHRSCFVSFVEYLVPLSRGPPAFS
jgi:hypothetical protein